MVDFGKNLVKRNLAASLITSLLVALLVAGFKLVVSTRTGMRSSFVPHTLSLVKGAIGAIVSRHDALAVYQRLYQGPDGAILTIGGVLGLLVFGYVYRALGRSEIKWLAQANWCRVIFIGLGIYGLGYVIFLATDEIGFPIAGRHNRYAIAACIGLAVALVGGLGCLATLLPSESTRTAFSLLMALAGVVGCLTINTTASFWVKADRQEQEILADIRRHFPSLPAGSTFILDGVCLQVGSATVFKYRWDFEAALQISYRDSGLRADIVTPALKVEEEGLSALTSGEADQYTYDRKLLVYNFSRKLSYQLVDADAARRYFRTFNPDFRNDCP